MEIKSILLLSLSILALNVSCNNDLLKFHNPISKEIWENIGPPFSDKTESCEDNLKKVLSNKRERDEIRKYILKKIQSKKISLDDAIRLAIIFNRMVISTPENSTEEQLEMLKILETGRRHINFYGAVLSVAPPLFLSSIEIFKENFKVMAQAPSPEGGIIEYNVKEMFLLRLNEATQQDFGPNYANWSKWWEDKGQFLKYDNARMKYINSGDTIRNRKDSGDRER